jgi:peroxiredoxin Q/BCP
MKLEIGELAPDFELKSDEGREVKLSSLRGKRVLLFFFPRADTPGCTTQACGFRDNYRSLAAAGALVLGVSPDTVKDLKHWRAKEKLPYNLLSDPDHQVADLYGAWGEKHMFGRTYDGIIRSHFVVGADGRLEDVQVAVSPQESIDRAIHHFAAQEP